MSGDLGPGEPHKPRRHPSAAAPASHAAWGQRRESRLAEAIAEGLPTVLAAYVFGSRAADRARSTSDLDVALLVDDHALDPQAELSLRLDALAALERQVAPLQLDLLVITPGSDPLLAFEVQRGRRIMVRDLSRCLELEAHLRSRYYDTAPLRRVQERYLRQWFEHEAGRQRGGR